jgi:hypothetical protein
MKNVMFLLITATIAFSSLSAKAGKLKNIIIDTDDAITEELTSTGQGGDINSISNHKFVPYEDGVAVEAMVSGDTTDLTCTVYFKKFGENYSPTHVVCE